MKIFFAGIFALFVLAAGAQAPLKFTINGTLKNVQPEARLVKLTYFVDGQQKDDSAWIKNGSYTLSGQLSEPRMGYFSVQYVADSLNKKKVARRDNFTAYLDNGTITLVSTDSFSNRTVSGSKAQEVFEMLSSQEKAYEPQFRDISKQIQELKDNREAIKPLQEKARALDKEMREKVYAAYIRSNPSSPMAMYALSTYAGYMMNPDEVEPLYNLLSGKIKNSYSGKDFLGKLEGAKRLRVGMTATDFTQNDTSGVPVKFSSLKGKYVLVDFWASWCGPCRRENPNVVAAFDKYKNSNFTVLGVALEHEGDKDKWMKAIYKDGLAWTHVSDFKYFSNEVAKLYGINAIPRNFLVDPAGKIVATDLRGEALQKKLEELLSK